MRSSTFPLLSSFIFILSGVLLFSLGLFGAYSYFSSQTQITNNVLSFGTLTMKLNGAYDTLTAVWSGTNLKPGDTISGSFQVANTGSLDAQALGLKFQNTGFKTTNSPTLDHKLRLTSLTYDNTQLITAIQTALSTNTSHATVSGITITASHTNGLSGLDTNNDDYLSLGELNNQELIFQSASSSPLNGLKANTNADIALSLYFVPGSNDNDYQADSVTTNITGTLYQVAP